jgi:hypothetical protein
VRNFFITVRFFGFVNDKTKLKKAFLEVNDLFKVFFKCELTQVKNGGPPSGSELL